MTMVAKSDARRLYPRAGSLVLCFDGMNFGPKGKDTTKLTADDKVTIEVLAKAGGKHRVQVTQVVEGGKPIVEIWTSRVLERIRPARTAKAG